MYSQQIIETMHTNAICIITLIYHRKFVLFITIFQMLQICIPEIVKFLRWK